MHKKGQKHTQVGDHKGDKTHKDNECMKKKFRISAKRVFLTFSQVPEALTCDQVLCQLSAKQSVHRYLIAEELHQDGGKHFHVLLESKTKFNIRDERALDISYESDSYHGNYQEARNYKRVAKYVGKDSNYITNYTNFCDGEFLTIEEDMLRISPELGPERASQYYLKNYTSHALKGMSIRNASKYLQSVNNTLLVTQDDKQTSAKLPFCLHENFRLPPEIERWISRGHQPTLLLVGEGGTGKTAFAKAIAEANQWSMLICNHLEGLKALTPLHDIIVYDDLSFKDIDDQQLLAIVANDETKQVRVLNGAVEKRQGIKQIITLNTNVFKKLKNKLNHRQFLRRLTCVKLEQSMVMNLNVNVEINNHTNIYNNAQNIEDNERLFDNL